MFTTHHNPPIHRVLIFSMGVVALVPLVLLTLHLYKAGWDNSWREIREKHQLIAANLAQPIRIYVQTHQNTLEHLAHEIESDGVTHQQNIHIALKKVATDIKGFTSLSYIDTQGRLIAYTHTETGKRPEEQIFSTEKCYLRVKSTVKTFVSGVKASPFTGKPTLFIGQPVVVNDKLQGVLLAELQIELIEALRKNVKFGKKGHAAIVDQNGHVIAHPNPAWMKEMKDISSWPIVQKMMAGETGVTEFYSSFIKENMVAGYASVADIGWGIMVPQPKSEVAAHVNELMSSNYAWGIAGLILAALLGLLMASWLTRPINNLARQSKALVSSNFEGDIKEPEGMVPKELAELTVTLHSLVHGLQSSRNEVTVLNENLQQRVNDATEKLRKANKQLEKAAQSDYLTKLANRRHFEEQLGLMLTRRSSDINDICILLIDVDNFKQINDKHGHLAGDVVLTHVARILESAMRPGDLLARYGGDEFVTRLRCDKSVALDRAMNLRKEIEQNTIPWQGEMIHITVSIGVYCQSLSDTMNVESVMNEVDKAMYQAKREGRNRVSQLYT